MATAIHEPGRPQQLQESYIDLFWRWALVVEHWVNAAFNNRLNPFYFHGALPNFFLMALFTTGILLMFHYVPTQVAAYREIEWMTYEVPFGVWMRSIHRYAADGMLIVVFVHMFRVWFTDRYRGARILPWLTGVALLWLLYIVGTTGYMLIWDGRAQVVTAMTLDMFKFSPALQAFLIGGSSITDFTLSRFYSYHIGLAVGIFFFLVLHYIRLYKPKTSTPMPLWMVFLGITFMVAGFYPVTTDVPFDAFLPGTAGEIAGESVSRLAEQGAAAGEALAGASNEWTIDWLYLWPYGLYYSIGAGAFWAFMGLVLVLFFVPYYVKTKRPFAYVIEEACVGCQLCYLDCPFNAIEMVEKPSLKAGRKPKLLAIVYEARCTSCGVCVGACAYEAIEIPRVRSQEIEATVAAMCQ